MYTKCFIVIICLNLILTINSQSQDDDYNDYDSEQPIRTGNRNCRLFFVFVS